MMKKELVASVEASPFKSAAEDLAALRKTFRLVCRCYMERVEMEIIRVQERVANAGQAASDAEARKPPTATGGRAKLASANGSGGDAARLATSSGGSATSAQIHDLRDMLTLLRTLEVKPEVGRRKDLKKIESLVEDLRLLSAGWA